MIFMVTWTSTTNNAVCGVSAGTLSEAATVYDALLATGHREVVVWNPRQVAVMVSNPPASLARHADDERAAKGCTHPPDEPCIGKPRLYSPEATARAMAAQAFEHHLPGVTAESEREAREQDHA